MHLVSLILIPLLILGSSFLLLRTSFTWKEFLLSMGVAVITLVIGWQLAKWGALRSDELLNGRITKKVDGTQGCCHCHDECDSHDKKGNCTSSHKVCSHSHDYYWNLETSVGSIEIENCSGDDDPPSVWEYAIVGEPASVEHGYNNYLLADPDSLFVRSKMAKFEGQIPKYPSVHNHYRADHVIGDVPAPNGWQEAVREINGDLGAANQVDVTIVLTSNGDPTYAQALEAKWLYGPKNSLNIVMGIEGGTTIRWVRVVTFSRVEMLKVRLRDQLQTLKLDDPNVLAIIRREVQQGFRRTAMAEFEYLARTAQPKGWMLALLYLFEIFASIVLVYLMNKHDVFGDEDGAFRDYGSNPFKRGRNPFKRGLL